MKGGIIAPAGGRGGAFPAIKHDAFIRPEANHVGAVGEAREA